MVASFPSDDKLGVGLGTRLEKWCFFLSTEVPRHSAGCVGTYVQSIAVAFEHSVLRDRVRQELSVGGASRK